MGNDDRRTGHALAPRTARLIGIYVRERQKPNGFCLYDVHYLVRFLLFFAFFCWFIQTFITMLWGSSLTRRT